MTEAQFWMRVVKYQAQWPSQRLGQAAFNVLCEVRPDLAEKVRGSGIDPFYVREPSDKRWFGFLKFLAENWGDA